MNTVARYQIMCPCGEAISMLERNLEQVVSYLRWSDRVAPDLVFVCSRCKTAFRYDYLNRKPAEMIQEPPLGSMRRFVCFVEQKCGVTGCGSYVEVVAIRSYDTSPESFQSEMKGWDCTKIICEKHDPLLPRSI